MNKKGLVESLLKALSARKDAQNAVDIIFSQIRKALRTDEKVILAGIGSFNTVITKTKKCRNPKTGEILHLPPRKKVRFRQSKDLFK